jgi:hypothetical protein
VVVWGVKVSTDWQVGLFYSLYFVYEAIGVEFHSWRIFGSALTKSPGTILVISRRISCRRDISTMPQQPNRISHLSIFCSANLILAPLGLMIYTHE